MKSKQGFFAHITRIKSDLFEINGVDKKQLVSIDHMDVKRVQEGYGATRNARGNCVHPHPRVILLAAFVGVLIRIVALATPRD